jgi:HD superfamily phosphohydrolase
MREKIRRHLEHDYTNPVRDPLWKHIYFSDGLIDIINSLPFQELAGIKQLGPAYMVYPGATHTRFSHSLGVFHIAERLIKILLRAEEALPLSLEGVKAFLCASLIHDLGHFPFAHSLKELPLLKHEVLTGQVVLSEPLNSLIKDRLGADPYTVAAIVDHDLPNRGNNEIQFFRNILSGVLDPDKLDYLNRDAYFCGVPYGIQDVDFALSRILPHSDTGVAIDISGVAVVENILFSKYLMYRAVYWHRAVRVATAMIKKAVYLGLDKEQLRADDLYLLDDDTFFSKFRESSFTPFSLIKNVSERTLHKTVLEQPFDVSKRLHKDVLSLDTRFKKEQELAALLSSVCGTGLHDEDVIIDIPEQISFEIQLPVWNGKEFIAYPRSGTVFSEEVVHNFTSTLRRLRVMVSPEYADILRRRPEHLEEFFAGED